MDIFPWNANFETGIALVDEQHRALVDLLNVLVRHLSEQADSPTLEAVFDQMHDYALHHFHDEELIWQAQLGDDPWTTEHHQEHSRFIQDLGRLRAVQEGKTYDEVVLDIVAFLSHWLALHILESDQRLAHAMRARQAGHSADAARQIAQEHMSGHARAVIDMVMDMYGHLTHRTLELTREILQRRRTEALLLQAKAEAESANRAKSRLLAVVSHEIRNPLNGVIGMTELALRHATDPKQEGFLRKSVGAGRQLVGIVNDLLDFSRIEAGKLTLEHAPFRIGQVLEDVMRIAEVPGRDKRLLVQADVAPELLQTPWLGDPLRLGQVLMNLLSNAVKFTAEGSVRVAASLEADEGPARVVRFEVTDTGIGIAAEDQPRLFSEFEQADESMARRFGGTGLGLAISKRLAEAMGGAIGLHSVPGEGSTFWFTVRLEAAPPEAAD